MKNLFFLSVLLLFGCGAKNKTVNQQEDIYYTCTMHSQIRQDKPGNCPICGMELVLVKNGERSDDDSVQVLSDQQVQLGNIRADTLGRQLIGDRTVLSATLNMDESKSVTVNARIAGRIEKLYLKTTGEYLHKGERIYDLYSELLNNAKQEYLLALEKQKMLDNSIIDFKQLVESSRNKLQLWGMTENQINELAKTKVNSPVTGFFSPADGYVVSLESHEGDYVAEGATIFRLANLSVLWAEAQVYATQLSQIDQGGSAIVQVPGLSLEIPGTIEFVNPEINPSVRFNLIRVIIPNPGGLLKPGMPVYVMLKNRKSRALTLPADAVIRNEKGSMVWLQTGHNRYKPVIVKTGLEDGTLVEIISGLKSGDVVVTSGAYLLNSEYIIRHGTEPSQEQPL
jgi:membrane fusion protein, copper/silver efflux system